MRRRSQRYTDDAVGRGSRAWAMREVRFPPTAPRTAPSGVRHRHRSLRARLPTARGLASRPEPVPLHGSGAQVVRAGTPAGGRRVAAGSPGRPPDRWSSVSGPCPDGALPGQQPDAGLVRRVPGVGQLRTGGCRGHAERASGRWSRAPALPVGPATRPMLPPPPATRPVGSGVVRAGEPDPAEGSTRAGARSTMARPVGGGFARMPHYSLRSSQPPWKHCVWTMAGPAMAPTVAP
jgi:hypothetical protein